MVVSIRPLMRGAALLTIHIFFCCRTGFSYFLFSFIFCPSLSFYIFVSLRSYLESSVTSQSNKGPPRRQWRPNREYNAAERGSRAKSMFVRPSLIVRSFGPFAAIGGVVSSRKPGTLCGR